MKLKDLAKRVSGELVGSENPNIKRIASLPEAKAGDLVFVLEEKLLPQAIKSSASALVVQAKIKVAGKAAILVNNPRIAMADLLPLFALKTKTKKGIHRSAVIPKSCKIGKDTTLSAYVVLGENVTIGKNCMVHPNVTIYDNTVIGNRVIIHAGACLGVDGYGFVQEGGKHKKIPQIGVVVIEDDVEIFANVCISRGTLGETRIGQGTKIDNLSHIAHNCKIGKHCAIVSLVGFAGSVTLKDRVAVAGQVGFAGHITVGEDSIVMARTGVTKDIPANSVVSGFPAQDHRQEMVYRAALRRLAKKEK